MIKITVWATVELRMEILTGAPGDFFIVLVGREGGESGMDLFAADKRRIVRFLLNYASRNRLRIEVGGGTGDDVTALGLDDSVNVLLHASEIHIQHVGTKEQNSKSPSPAG